jgi:signal peptidase I
MVNGIPLAETSYLYTDAQGGQNKPSDNAFETTVPQGRLWVMGDHREISADSRVHMGEAGGGSIPANRVIGRAFIVVWPAAHWQILDIPQTFEQQGLAAALLPAAPLALGFAGAVPVTLLNRRRLRHR